MDLASQHPVVNVLHALVEGEAERGNRTGGGVAAGLRHRPGPGDDRADTVDLGHPGQGSLRGRELLGMESGERRELGCGRQAGLIVHAGEGFADIEGAAVTVVVAVVVRREGRLTGVLAGQQTARQRNAGDDAHASGPGGRHDVLERLQPERIQNDLHAGQAGPFDGSEGLVTGFDAHPVGGDGSLGDEGVERIVDLVGFDHVGGRAVQLHEVQGVQAEVRAGPVGPGPEIGEGVVLRPLIDPAAHLGGHGDCGAGVAVSQEPADDLFAAAITVDVGGVEEGDAGVDGCREHRRRVGLRHVTPVRSQLPGSQPDHGDGSAGSSEDSCVHTPSLATATLSESTSMTRASARARRGRIRWSLASTRCMVT